MRMKTAIEAYEEVEKLAKIKAQHEVRFIKNIEIGQGIRQGDIYIHRVPQTHPRGKVSLSNQLAIGETNGARHIADAPAEVYQGVKLPEWCDARTFLGPVVVLKKRAVISHPEHANVSLPSGTYQVTHQMDARTMKRVVD